MFLPIFYVLNLAPNMYGSVHLFLSAQSRKVYFIRFFSVYCSLTSIFVVSVLVLFLQLTYKPSGPRWPPSRFEYLAVETLFASGHGALVHLPFI
jgi:hypothetical protein